MKSIKNYISEALKINSKTKVIKTNYKYFPKTKEELIKIIDKRIQSEGDKCDLNDIDVSEITSMQDLFKNFQTFNGDISKWNVSNVTDMSWMFRNTDFNGDISKWNVSNVEEMRCMFRESKFNSDISNWDVSNVEDMYAMFEFSKFNSDISNWNVSNVKNMLKMFKNSKFNGDISNWSLHQYANTTRMFDNCPIEEKYKPNFKK